jgi:tRNA (guanosine-2'-O-)-methyltransferase
MNLDSKILEAFYNIISESKQDMFDEIASQRTRHITVVLENIFQDHNASAVLRTCDCFGIQDLHTIEKNNQYKVQRDIARGAGRWVDLYNYNVGVHPEKDCIQKLKEKGYKIIAATPHKNDCNLDDLPIDQPLAVVFGTEWQGISPEMLEMADGFVKIPMYGFTESFNVSVSAALVLQNLRDRLEKSDVPFKLSKEEQIQLKIKWSSKIIKNGHLLVDEIRKRLLEKED